MKKNNINFIVKSAIVAAMYVALTFAFQFMSYNAIQFRISEVLVLLVFFDKKYFWGLVVGCFITASIGPLGIYDIGFGVSATIIGLLGIIGTRKVFGENIKSIILASLCPVIANAVLVGIELTILFKELPFYLNAIYVAIGEFVVISIVGVIIFVSTKDRIKRIIEL